MIKAAAVFLALACASAAASLLMPKDHTSDIAGRTVSELVPSVIGDWHLVPSTMMSVDVSVKRDADDQSSLLYDEVVSRTYRKESGETIMLSIAWGKVQRQEQKIHRPELCYQAQGFSVRSLGISRLDLGGEHEQMATRLVATAKGRFEPVSYWIRIGNLNAISAWHSRMYILREGLSGRLVDGILIRVSNASTSEVGLEGAFAVHEDFVRSLFASLGDADRARLFVPEGTER